MTADGQVSPGAMTKACCRDEENGKKIKAISCELSAAS